VPVVALVDAVVASVRTVASVTAAVVAASRCRRFRGTPVRPLRCARGKVLGCLLTWFACSAAEDDASLSARFTHRANPSEPSAGVFGQHRFNHNGTAMRGILRQRHGTSDLQSASSFLLWLLKVPD